MPRVSVIIPAHNAGEFLPEALRSVQAQNFADWEVVAVDDGSRDDTWSILESAGPRVERSAPGVHGARGSQESRALRGHGRADRLSRRLKAGLGAKARAWRLVWTSRQALRARRREVQRNHRIGDRAIVERISASLDSPFLTSATTRCPEPSLRRIGGQCSAWHAPALDAATAIVGKLLSSSARLGHSRNLRCHHTSQLIWRNIRRTSQSSRHTTNRRHSPT